MSAALPFGFDLQLEATADEAPMTVSKAAIRWRPLAYVARERTSVGPHSGLMQVLTFGARAPPRNAEWRLDPCRSIRLLLRAARSEHSVRASRHAELGDDSPSRARLRWRPPPNLGDTDCTGRVTRFDL